MIDRWAQRSPRRQAGFGLLEAIVALALLAGAGLALFAWIQQNLQAASRLQTHEIEARLLLSAQALVSTVNPMLQPAGTLEMPGLRLQWTAEPMEPVRRNLSATAGVPGAFALGLYRMDVRALDVVSKVELRFEQWQVGSRRDALEFAPRL